MWLCSCRLYNRNIVYCVGSDNLLPTISAPAQDVTQYNTRKYLTRQTTNMRQSPSRVLRHSNWNTVLYKINAIFLYGLMVKLPGRSLSEPEVGVKTAHTARKLASITVYATRCAQTYTDHSLTFYATEVYLWKYCAACMCLPNYKCLVIIKVCWTQWKCPLCYKNTR